MPTPEEIQREQERLELIQRQNAAAKELVSTYEKMSKTVGSLTDEEKEILDIAKKISKSASDIEKSTSKRLDKTSSIKDLNRSLQALQQSQLKNADIAAKLEAERTNHLTKASELYRSAVNQRQSILDLEGTTSELIARRNAAERAGNADVAAELTRQIKANEFNIKQKEKRLAATTKEAQKERDLIKSLDETRKAHQNIVEEQQKEIKATEEELKQHSNFKRRYTDEFINLVVNVLANTLDTIIHTPETYKIYVQEKEKPRIAHQEKQIKDGIHIIIPELVLSNTALYYLREQLIEDEDILNNLNEIGNVSAIIDVFDKRIIYPNAWYLYGCGKPDDKGDTYTVSKTYKIVKNDDDFDIKQIGRAHV